MTLFDRLSESARLVSGMTSRLDIDLADRIAASPETAGRTFAAMVQRCAQCSDQAACSKLQEENPMLDAAPAYCRNRDVLHR
jgi:hypothetical protein